MSQLPEPTPPTETQRTEFPVTFEVIAVVDHRDYAEQVALELASVQYVTGVRIVAAPTERVETSPLPCPFCGNTLAKVMHVRDGKQVTCPCGASMVAFNPNAKSNAIAKWNCRAAVAPSPAGESQDKCPICSDKKFVYRDSGVDMVGYDTIPCPSCGVSK